MRHLPFFMRDVRKWSANERELFRSNYEAVRVNMVRRVSSAMFTTC
jgi:hypothetical protein